MEFTQKEILEALEDSNREQWNLRQMAALRKKAFLPPLRRKTQQGTNKPLYVWDETDLNQIVDVYDWWDYCDGDRVTLTLILWLQGYDIPLDPLRSLYIDAVEMYLQHLTQGNTDPDDILDKVSEVVVKWMRKMRYTPGLADQRKKMETKQNFSMAQMELFTESVLSALVVPDETLDTKDLHSFPSDTSASQNASADDTQDDDFFIPAEDVAVILRDILALPHLLEAIRTATSEQWQQARKDYLSFCNVLRVIEERRPKEEGKSLPEEFLLELKIMGAIWLTVPLLSTRYRGYGQWIDMAFVKFHEMLADPEVQERILNRHKARRAIEVAVEDREKPELSISE